MKAILFTIMTLAIVAQAQAGCGDRTGGTTAPRNSYSNQLPDSRVGKPAQAVQTVRASGADGRTRK